MCVSYFEGTANLHCIQAVHSLLYIVAKCHFFSCHMKRFIKYLQKCEECTLLWILYTHTRFINCARLTALPDVTKIKKSEIACKTCPKSANAACDSITIVKIDIFKCGGECERKSVIKTVQLHRHPLQFTTKLLTCIWCRCLSPSRTRELQRGPLLLLN